MKNTRRVAQIIAGVLAVMMILGVVLYIIPTSYAADNKSDTKTEEQKKQEEMKKEQEKYWRAVENERQYLVDKYTNEILSLIQQYKGKPGYYTAVKKLEDYLDSFSPRDMIDPNDILSVINSFSKDESEVESNPILMGDELGRFNPENKLTRAEFAVILSRLDGQPVMAGTNWFEPAMNHAKEKGYLKGNDSGDMMPTKQISIAEVITVFVRYKGFTPMEGNMSNIPKDHWAMGEMQRAYMDGWIKAIDNPNNCDRAITRGELASILTQVRGIKIDADKINEQLALYKTFADVSPGYRYYYDILVNTK